MADGIARVQVDPDTGVVGFDWIRHQSEWVACPDAIQESLPACEHGPVHRGAEASRTTRGKRCGGAALDVRHRVRRMVWAARWCLLT